MLLLFCFSILVYSFIIAEWILHATTNHCSIHERTRLTTPRSSPCEGGDKGEVMIKVLLVPPLQRGDKGEVILLLKECS